MNTNENNKKNRFIKNLEQIFTSRLLIGLLIGAIGGYAYYYFAGCSTNTCPITSNPTNSIIYGTLVGGLLFYRKKTKKTEDSHDKLS